MKIDRDTLAESIANTGLLRPNDPWFRETVSEIVAEYDRLAALQPEPLDVLDGARAEYRECLEVRRLLGYLWTATGRNTRIPVYEMFGQDDPIIEDVGRLAIFPEGSKDVPR